MRAYNYKSLQIYHFFCKTLSSTFRAGCTMIKIYVNVSKKKKKIDASSQKSALNWALEALCSSRRRFYTLDLPIPRKLTSFPTAKVNFSLLNKKYAKVH